MAAIITSEFRKNSRKIFTNDIKTSTVDDYFIGLGKTDSWSDTTDALGNQVTEYSRQFSAPLPTDTLINKQDVLENLMVLVESNALEVFNVIPRNNWSYNRIYKVYDPTDPKCFDYETIDGVAYYPAYVTSNDRIYVCLSNKDLNGEIIESTTAIPSGSGSPETSYHTPEKLSNGEGYIWAYVTSLDEDSKFYTDQFVNYTYPVPEKYTTIENSTGGLVYDFKVVNGGGSTEVNAANTEIFLVGTTKNGDDIVPVDVDVAILDQVDTYNTNADFNVTFGANGIESIKYAEPASAGNPPSWKKNYVSASILVRTFDSANPSLPSVIRQDIDIIPFVLPYEGLGRYPDNDLPSYYAGIAVDFIGEVDGEAPVGFNVDIRQISLIKNPVRNPLVTSETDNDQDVNEGFYANDEAYDALRYLTLTAGTLQKDYIGRDFIIEQEVTGAKAWLDYVDNINEKVYYHQNSSPMVNFKKFSVTDPESTNKIKITSIAGFNDGEKYQVTGVVDPEYMPRTGEVIFYENRKPINRNYNQTDEVKLVIQF